MAKRSRETETPVVDPLLGGTDGGIVSITEPEMPAQAVVETPVVDVPPAPTPEIKRSPTVDMRPKLKPVPELVNVDPVVQHLNIVKEYRSITVPTFRELTGAVGRDAVNLLKGYAAAGLLERTWQSGYGRYSLTNKGERLINKATGQ